MSRQLEEARVRFRDAETVRHRHLKTCPDGEDCQHAEIAARDQAQLEVDALVEQERDE